MLKRLIISATSLELEAWLAAKGFINTSCWGAGVHPIDPFTDLLITGVGAASCACMVGTYLHQYDAFYHVGFAGAYQQARLEVGQCVVVGYDAFASYALLRAGALRTIESAGFSQAAPTQANGAWTATAAPIPEPWRAYPVVSALTVASPGQTLPQLPAGLNMQPSIETMEGAAFALAMAAKPASQFLSLRVVSNLVAPEEQAAWDVPLAKSQLAKALSALDYGTAPQLRWAYSPCPNDTFVFAGIAQRAVAHGVCHAVELLDIAELNEAALSEAYDVIKISAAHYPRVADRYAILPAGAALGYGVGPLLISSRPKAPMPTAADAVLVPGRSTTAHALLRLFCPEVREAREVRFSEIVPRIRGGEAEYGVLIHEGRFTYQQQGLRLVADLGAMWERAYALPLPLGVICARRALPAGVRQAITQAIRSSLTYAWANRQAVYPYVAQHAQELLPAVRAAHIQLYANGYTYDLGSEGERALRKLNAIGMEQGRDVHPAGGTGLF